MRIFEIINSPSFSNDLNSEYDGLIQFRFDNRKPDMSLIDVIHLNGLEYNLWVSTDISTTKAFYLTDGEDNALGYLVGMPYGDTVKITSVFLHTSARSKGLGLLLYKTILDNGYKLKSDLAQTIESKRIWRSLASDNRYQVVAIFFDGEQRVVTDIEEFYVGNMDFGDKRLVRLMASLRS